MKQPQQNECVFIVSIKENMRETRKTMRADAWMELYTATTQLGKSRE